MTSRDSRSGRNSTGANPPRAARRGDSAPRSGARAGSASTRSSASRPQSGARSSSSRPQSTTSRSGSTRSTQSRSTASRPAASRSGSTRAASSRSGSARSTQSRSTASRPAASRSTSAKSASRRTASQSGARTHTRSGSRPRATTTRPSVLGALAQQAAAFRARRRARGPVRWGLGSGSFRLKFVLVVLVLAVATSGIRLIQLQGFDANSYAAAAERQLTRKVPLPAMRGTITDRNGTALAVSEAAVAITCDPSLTAPKADYIAERIVAHVGGTKEDYLPALTKENTKFAYVAKKVPAAQFQRLADELSKEGIYGIFRESDPLRYYPEGDTAAGVVGFLNAENRGGGGLEYALEKQLAGEAGSEVFESSPAGLRIPLGSNVLTPATNGVNYQLTIDAELQAMAEELMKRQQEDIGAESGTLITMNVKTGEVLAMVNTPSFDSNRTAAARAEDLGNRAVSQTYEPGSVQKILTMAALIDGGTMSPDTRLVLPPSIESGGGRVTDVWDHGYTNATATGVMVHSSNIGTIMLARQMEKAQYRQYLYEFGIGRPTGIELPGEAAGYLPAADMPDATRDQISFGQGFSTTALQTTAAVAGILNGGVYNQPTIIKSATDADGNPVQLPERESRRVVSEETSKEVAGLMEAVIGPGGPKELGMDDYRSGGKTGTAEVYQADKGKYEGLLTSFLGAAPVEDPQIVTYVSFMYPKTKQNGAHSAGPVYRDVTRAALKRFAVQPSTTKSPKYELEW